MAQTGKRAGARRGVKPKRTLDPSLFLLALGVTLTVVAWGYLVYAAIDFGSAGRGGDPRAWAFLGLAALGAVACLFVGLMMVGRLLRRLGITGPRRDDAGLAAPAVPAPPRPIGGRRASR